MILLDPDLDPDPSPRTMATKSAAPAGISTRSLALFLRKAQAAVRLRGQVSVLLTTDAAIRKLNRQFRGKNKATDVLSFPALDLYAVSRSRPGAAAVRISGDLAISVDTARKQAAGQGHALTCELKILMLHGLLHLAGYDHENDGGKMAARERLLRAKFGLPLGLIERAWSPTLATERNRKNGARSMSASQQVGKSERRSLPTLSAKGAARMGHSAPAGSRKS
jgi:probable rRNA maturation factor